MHRRRPATTVRRARRALAVLILSTLLLFTVAGPAVARTSRRILFDDVNRSRRSHDVRPVRMHLRLSQDALRHTRRMVRRNRLYDVRNLSDVLRPYEWRRYGAAVVGCASTLHELHRALMRDAPHRRIILNAKARRVGIGVVRVDGRSACGRNAFWATEIFYG